MTTNIYTRVKEVENKVLKFFLIMIFPFVGFCTCSGGDFGSAYNDLETVLGLIKLNTY